ncbi:hypothetical protein BDR06DRAFT_1061816 [Suillus hirtellus]|nr:hypothetical protein BDR06DRAFT_1061816 [Suillus hirtellus]
MYITKSDLKTHEMLLLLSRAVTQVSSQPGDTEVENAKCLLHKCLTQFACQQQIHAQQAVHYLRGYGDDIASHETIPMLSGLLLSHVRLTYSGVTGTHLQDDEGTENMTLNIATDKAGRVITMNQVHHYLHWGASLRHMCFYDFCQFVRLELKSKTDRNQNTADTRLEHTNVERSEGHAELVPRVVGMCVPRKTVSETWALFALAHFKPFGFNDPLIEKGADILESYSKHEFTQFACQVMRNWEAIHECEDERDADRLLKRAAAAAKG